MFSFRSKQSTLTVDVIRAKSESLHQQRIEESGDIYPPFTASRGWFERFKSRHSLKFLRLKGELQSADVDGLEEFKKMFRALINEEGYSLDQLYNADETALILKLVPQKTIASVQEKIAHGRKKDKEKVTVMPCANVSGSNRLPLMVIGTATNPRPKDKSLLPGESQL